MKLIKKIMGPFTKIQRRYWMSHPTFDKEKIYRTCDPIRYATLALAINTILAEDIKGDFVELGVYKGDTSRMIHQLAPNRKLFLFDTFEGFNSKDLECSQDGRFKDTSLAHVKQNIGDLNNVYFKVGHFPESAQNLESNQFAFVMMDMDLFAPTLAALEFFYPKMVKGGYIFIHDYNSNESQCAMKRVVKKFSENHPVSFIEIPDVGGSIVWRKG